MKKKHTEPEFNLNVKKKLMENVTSKNTIKINVIVRYKKKKKQILEFRNQRLCSILLSRRQITFSLYFSCTKTKQKNLQIFIYKISSVMLFCLSTVKSMISYG